MVWWQSDRYDWSNCFSLKTKTSMTLTMRTQCLWISWHLWRWFMHFIAAETKRKGLHRARQQVKEYHDSCTTERSEPFGLLSIACPDTESEASTAGREQWWATEVSTIQTKPRVQEPWGQASVAHPGGGSLRRQFVTLHLQSSNRVMNA